ncbi:uncharacterized protein LOC124921444 [Impatiens glandulifera]|uniref:uncharacterized protein LOC124921444 n=1 Tax=Impatiens glandulifera TaxID=253017 RepID=UPI001FB06AEA|nr:uncharacterized protein LOC124921444 [Impatiens glandulifera]
MNSKYPRVKVRSQDDDDDDDRSRRLYLDSLMGIQSTCLDDLDSLVSVNEEESPPSIVVRIPSSYIPKKNISSTPSSKILPLPVKRNNSSQKKSEECKQNIRASSVPRPRAVLSSPDNDAMIGSTTKSRLLLSGVKHNSCQQDRHVQHNLCQQDKHVQRKLIPKRVSTETPIFSRKETKDPASIKTAGFRERKGRTVGDSAGRLHLTS